MQDTNNFFLDKKMPYLECRYSNSSKNYKEHMHDTFSIGAIVKGQREFHVNKKSFQVKANYLAIINSNQAHSCNTDKNNTQSEYYVLYLDNAWCLNLQKSLFSSLSTLQNFSKYLLEDEELFQEFVSLCALLFSQEFYLKKEEVLINFMHKLYKKYLKLNNKPYKYDGLDEVAIYIKENVSYSISLDKLDKKFDINKFVLIRSFNKKYGLSVHSYFINLKINHAKVLLKEGNTIVNTTLELGFNDQSHFHRHFLKRIAATAKDYQKENK